MDKKWQIILTILIFTACLSLILLFGVLLEIGIRLDSKNIIEEISLGIFVVSAILLVFLLLKMGKNKKVESEKKTEESTEKVDVTPKHTGLGKDKKLAVVAIILIVLFSIVSLSILLYEENRYTLIQNNYNSLKNNYDSLSSNYNSLQTNYNSLQSNYNSLQNNFNSVQSSYNSYKRTVEVRWGQGADCEQFVTPKDPSVISATIGVLGHRSDGDLSWNDMTAINNWVGENIQYNHDTFDGNREECWFYPSETLSCKYGDCEEHALLMVSMCKAEGNVQWLWCAEINLQDGSGHMCVFIDVTGGNLFIFDPTSQPQYFFGFMIRGAWSSGTGKPVYQALQQYENECWSGQTITVSKIFNEQTYHTFNNNQEFSDFWTK